MNPSAAPSAAGAMPRVGVGALVWRGEQVLLVQRAKPPHQGLWTLPGGKLRWGETLSQAAEREVWEETSVQVSAQTIIHVFELLATAAGYHYVIVDLLCHYQQGEPVAADDASQAAWVDYARLDHWPVEEQTLALVRAYFQQRLPGLAPREG